MPTLMTLPRELRDQICGYVIHSQRRERPALDQTFEELTRHREIFSKPTLRSWCTTVLYLPEGAVANTASLSLVNQQLHAETQENIKLIKSCVYELDVIILDEILPLPTWIYVPTLTTSLKQVNTTFRISGCYNAKNDGRGSKDGSVPPGPYRRFGQYKGFRDGDGAGPALSWQIYSILERFFKAGPTGESTDASKHRHVTAKTLDINIETPPGVDLARFGSQRSARSPRAADNQDSILDPGYLAHFIAGRIGGLLGGANHEWFSYGKVLFEHVDTVVMRKDGEEFIRFDVAKRLKVAGGFEERYFSKERLADYKAWAWEKRAERGLKVLKD